VIGFHKDKIIDAQGLEGFVQTIMKLKKSANLTFNHQVTPQAVTLTTKYDFEKNYCG
jgi:hypothetical protein